MKPNYEELEKNICYVIKEQHIKLGFSDNSRWLYYPLSALNHMLGTECDIDGMEETLEGFFEYAEERLGPGKVTHKGERFCLHMDPKASVYVCATTFLRSRSSWGLSTRWRSTGRPWIR